MEEKTISAKDATLLVAESEEKQRIISWNHIMDKIIAECTCHRVYECNFDGLNEAEVQRLQGLGYTVKLIKPVHSNDYHRVNWPEEKDSLFEDDDMKEAFT